MIELSDRNDISFPLVHDDDVPLRFNLNWWRAGDAIADHPADIDLACMYETMDGRRGIVQAVGGHFGNMRRAPHISLTGDDLTGQSESGEELVIFRPDQVRFAVVSAAIYSGVGDFQGVGTELTISHEHLEDDVRVRLESPDPGLRWCAILVCGASHNEFAIVYQERYFLSARHADRHYGFDLEWGVGVK